MIVRSYQPRDRRRLWALDALPNIGETADPSLPLALPEPSSPGAFADLSDVPTNFDEFVVVELDGHVVGMGGLRLSAGASGRRAEVLRVRVHPAVRRRGVGSALMDELGVRARALGATVLHLDTATNQPEAMAFYEALGWVEVGRETRPEWTWTLVYYEQRLD